MSVPVDVVAAVIHHKGTFLCTQRGQHRFPYLSEKFEFPGGKVETGESQEAALVREIYEELRMKIRPILPLISVNHQYPDFGLVLHAWLCETEQPEYELREHLQGCWLPAERLRELDWAAADVPVLDLISRPAQSDENQYWF
jgi:8-oxo-dGTP diphosphatase